MNSTTYTPQQCSDVVQLYAAVQSNPPDRQTIIMVIQLGWDIFNPLNAINEDETTRFPFAVYTPAVSASAAAAIYRREMIAWIRQEGVKRDKPRDFSAITAENFHDFFDDMRDEISPKQREFLRRDVLAGRVPGFIDEDGAMHLGQGPVVRRPAEE